MIKTKLVNHGGGTNLEEALTSCLLEPSSVLFMTDGMANAGFLKTSRDLIKLARAFPSYSNSIINSLGIQQTSETSLNADLLKQLAIDTNGSFRVAPDAETLSCFVGDVITNHYFRMFDRVKIEVISSNGISCEIVAEPLAGQVIRLDRPTYSVFKIPKDAVGPFNVIVRAMPADSTGLVVSVTTSDGVADMEQINQIVGCVSAQMLDKKIGFTADYMEGLLELTKSCPKLMPIVLAAQNSLDSSESGENVNLSQQVYNFASLGGGDADASPAVMEVRAASASLALSQFV